MKSRALGLSVVIPAYNVESYIEACITSVLNQAHCGCRLRVIVVVDGATDRTLKYARRAALQAPSLVQIVVQANRGLSGARNAGLECVDTEFVTFLDGDDVWLGGYLEAVVPLLTVGGIDVLEYDAVLIDDEGKRLGPLKIAKAPGSLAEPITKDDFLSLFRCYAWARIYRAELVRARPFPEGRRFEDTATTPWYYWQASNLMSVGKPLIGYRQRAGSILVTPRQQDVEDIAVTTTEAAEQYFETGAPYWQHVAHRSFQQGCRRTMLQPLRSWAVCARISRRAIAGVPPPAGLARGLQARATLFYIGLLFIKRQILG